MEITVPASCTWLQNIIQDYCAIYFGCVDKNHCQVTKFILSICIRTTIAHYRYQSIHDYFFHTNNLYTLRSQPGYLVTYAPPPKQKKCHEGKFLMSGAGSRKASLFSPKSDELPSDTPVRTSMSSSSSK